jgi:nucleoside 2-deoxyribosyltransferase
MSTKDRNIVYIAGPYLGASKHHDARSYLAIDENISVARKVMVELVALGYGVFCPHMHSAHMEVMAPTASADYWYEIDLHFLKSCDALLRIPGRSHGSDMEVAFALENNIKVFYSIEDLVYGGLSVYKGGRL